MNIYLLGAGLLALLLGLGGWWWLRRRSRAPAREAGAHTPAAPAAGLPRPAPSAERAVAATPSPTMPATGPSAESQRQAATEALRQARLRKAGEAARLESQRQAGELREARPPSSPAVAQTQTAPRPQAPPRPLAPPVSAGAPAPQAQRQGPTALQLPTPMPSRPPAPQPQRPAGPARVVLADDSKVVRVKTGRLLESQGWQVLLAEDGLAALQLIEQAAPDLLITDVEMPGLDGFELTRRLRAQARWRRLPVIMITSSDDKHRDEARAAGVDLLLGKPYAEQALLDQVQRLIGERAGLALH